MTPAKPTSSSALAMVGVARVANAARASLGAVDSVMRFPPSVHSSVRSRVFLDGAVAWRSVNATLTRACDDCAMVTRKRLRSFLTALCLYTIAALLIGYFGVNAYTGNHGLKARQDLVLQMGECTREPQRAKAERSQWERRISLLKSESLAPDMLDERARALLKWIDPRDVTMILKP